MRKLRAHEPFLYEVDQIDEMYKGEDSGLDKFVRVITDRIQPPFSIAIDGPWGAGKTTLLMLVRDRLAKSNYPTVWFNPWEYDYSDDVVLAFHRKIACEYVDTFQATIQELGIFSLSLITAGAAAVAKKLAGIDYTAVEKIQENVRAALSGNRYGSFEDVVEMTKKDFVRLTTKVGQKNEYQGKPLVIFLDDLDRCLPENALRLLEALKNQFIVKTDEGVANVLVIAAIDTGVAKRFILKKYEGIGLDFAANYFKKIFK